MKVYSRLEFLVHILTSGKIRFASVEYCENFAHSKNEVVQEKREIAKSNKENESELTDEFRYILPHHKMGFHEHSLVSSEMCLKFF